MPIIFQTKNSYSSNSQSLKYEWSTAWLQRFEDFKTIFCGNLSVLLSSETI